MLGSSGQFPPRAGDVDLSGPAHAEVPCHPRICLRTTDLELKGPEGAGRMAKGELAERLMDRVSLTKAPIIRAAGPNQRGFALYRSVRALG
jgi:hypothetical protein